ncbi:hypothetical protein M0765_026435 [Variovorax sp. S2]|uniref:DUF6950 family protein n=1 Tax=Variovorax sp. S12S4 TaxID=3029170 RepID=UPI00215CDA9E|nr:hypothetical protein [Variovorax sp. S12S4]MCR8961137.1 hypothetical protein [Variovorax sp. S12S4]
MRHQDWQLRFSDFGKARASMPFGWGSNDCCTFAAAAVKALTGADPMVSVPSYDSASTAARMIEEGGGLEQLASSFLGQPVPVAMAAVGDIVLVLNANRQMLGVCNGTNVLAPGEAGMAVLGMDAALAAWKI